MTTTEITLRGATEYNTNYPPKDAKKGYVAKITGRAPGAVKYRREFLGESVTLTDFDTGLYERQIGKKKGGFVRYYHVVLDHPEHGLILSTDCEDQLPRLSKSLDDGMTIEDAVEVTNLRPSENREGVMVFDVVVRSASAAKKAAAAATIGEAVDACVGALAPLDDSSKRKALAELRKRLAPPPASKKPENAG